MTQRTPSTVKEYELESRFQSIRKILLEPQYADRQDKSLAYWAMPTDRRLPMALLNRTLSELLSTPFQELLGTPGIGQKKLASLITLLTRASSEEAVSVPQEALPINPRTEADLFDAETVSEGMWSRWCQTVEEHGLGHLPLGRLPSSLQSMPTVIWSTPFSYYVGRTLAEIRKLKTHGDKRVRVILEVFYYAHQMLGGTQPQSHITIGLQPSFVTPLQRWIEEALVSTDEITGQEVREALAEPMLAQTKVDLGEMVEGLAANRLGLNVENLTVRQSALELGITRARIYQLFDDCAKAYAVRWPEGRWQLAALYQRLSSKGSDPKARTLVTELMDLFYTDRIEPERVGPRIRAIDSEKVAGAPLAR